MATGRGGDSSVRSPDLPKQVLGLLWCVCSLGYPSGHSQLGTTIQNRDVDNSVVLTREKDVLRSMKSTTRRSNHCKRPAWQTQDPYISPTALIQTLGRPRAHTYARVDIRYISPQPRWNLHKHIDWYRFSRVAWRSKGCLDPTTYSQHATQKALGTATTLG